MSDSARGSAQLGWPENVIPINFGFPVGAGFGIWELTQITCKGPNTLT